MKTLLLVLAFMLVTSPVYAGAEKCKDAKITVINERDEDIKVLDMKYYDFSARKMRNENGVSSKVIEEGENDFYTRDLEEVLRGSTYIIVEYKISDRGKWRDATWSKMSNVATCVEGQEYTVRARDTD